MQGIDPFTLRVERSEFEIIVGQQQTAFMLNCSLVYSYLGPLPVY